MLHRLIDELKEREYMRGRGIRKVEGQMGGRDDRERVIKYVCKPISSAFNTCCF